MTCSPLEPAWRYTPIVNVPVIENPKRQPKVLTGEDDDVAVAS